MPRSYLGEELKEQLFKNNKELNEMSKNTLEKYWYNDRFTPPKDDAYYFIGRKKGVKHFIIERDEEKSPKLW